MSLSTSKEQQLLEVGSDLSPVRTRACALACHVTGGHYLPSAFSAVGGDLMCSYKLTRSFGSLYKYERNTQIKQDGNLEAHRMLLPRY
jgi:hypothetical protein